MAFALRVRHEDGILIAQSSGSALFADLCGMADLVGTITAMSGEHRAVLDLLAVDIGLGFTDHLQLGSYVAQRLHHLERVASIVPQRYRTGTSEKAAQKGGLQLRTFTELGEGLRWVNEARAA